MRRGFTLVETLVAMLLTSLMVLAVFGGLTFVGRGYQRDELAMARAQVAESVSELLGDDLRHLSGSAVPGADQLKANGYEGTPKTFVSEPRRGTHQVASFHTGVSAREGLGRFDYQEEAVAQANTWVVQMLTSHYLARPSIDPAPPPWGPVPAAYLVPLPPDNPDVVHLALATRHGGALEQVLWSFWRRRRGKFEAGAILRYGPEGAKSLSATPLQAKLTLSYEWVRLVSAKDTQIAPVEERVELDLREPGDLTLPFVEPQFRIHRVFAAGL